MTVSSCRLPQGCDGAEVLRGTAACLHQLVMEVDVCQFASQLRAVALSVTAEMVLHSVVAPWYSGHGTVALGLLCLVSIVLVASSAG